MIVDGSGSAAFAHPFSVAVEHVRGVGGWEAESSGRGVVAAGGGQRWCHWGETGGYDVGEGAAPHWIL